MVLLKTRLFFHKYSIFPPKKISLFIWTKFIDIQNLTSNRLDYPGYIYITIYLQWRNIVTLNIVKYIREKKNKGEKKWNGWENQCIIIECIEPKRCVYEYVLDLTDIPDIIHGHMLQQSNGQISPVCKWDAYIYECATNRVLTICIICT